MTKNSLFAASLGRAALFKCEVSLFYLPNIHKFVEIIFLQLARAALNVKYQKLSQATRYNCAEVQTSLENALLWRYRFTIELCAFLLQLNWQ